MRQKNDSNDINVAWRDIIDKRSNGGDINDVKQY